MRVCLANAAIAAEFTDPSEFCLPLIREETTQPQLGILSLAAVLEETGFDPCIVDLNRVFFDLADADGETGVKDFVSVAASRIVATEAEAYGFGTICSAYPLTVRIAKKVKALRPNSAIVFGGPQASVVSKETLAAFPWIDFVLRGEAEQSLPLFLEALEAGKGFSHVPGLTYRSLFGVQANPDAPVVANLDELPSPAYHLTGELYGASKAALEIGRGCPFSCTFCSTNDFFRRKFRLRSPERVIADMRAIDAEYGIRTFALTHDMFTVDHKRVRAFCKAMLESGTNYKWSCSARTDSVDEELLELMAAAGCTGIFFGVETGSQRMQKIIDKHLDIEWAHKVIDIAERAGIGTVISLIMGFPPETKDDLRDTVRMFMHSARTPGSKPQLNLLCPLANTPIHLQYKDQMTLEPLCADCSHQGCNQDIGDIELIQRYPEIFPNFYLIPTPEIDRKILIELREFALMAQTRFCWILVAADQVAGGLLDLFAEWLKNRVHRYPEFTGKELRRYYRSMHFVGDFLSFLHAHPAGADPAVSRLMTFEEALAAASCPAKSLEPDAVEIAPGEGIEASDIPCRRDQSKVVELNFDLQETIDAVKGQRAPGLDPRARFYIVKQALGITNPIYEVSPRIAKASRICNGVLTVGQIAEQLAGDLPEITEEWRSLYSLGLVEKAWNEGILAIYRTRSVAVSSQGSGNADCAYSSMSALASEQNQSLIQAQ